ncbi:MAG: hypothetical protein CI947_1802, partial [Halanaerobium sp.]
MFEDRTLLSIFVILCLAVLVAFIVYFTGGTRFSYAHLIYLPIILAAYFYKIKGGITAALIGGFLLGPYMPLNTSTMTMQGLENWTFRMSLLVIVGTFAGYLFSLLESQLEQVNQIAYYDSETGLPNKLKLKKELEKEIESLEEKSKDTEERLKTIMKDFSVSSLEELKLKLENMKLQIELVENEQKAKLNEIIGHLREPLREIDEKLEETQAKIENTGDDMKRFDKTLSIFRIFVAVFLTFALVSIIFAFLKSGYLFFYLTLAGTGASVVS